MFNKINSSQTGFTLIEVLVAIILTGLVLSITWVIANNIGNYLFQKYQRYTRINELYSLSKQLQHDLSKFEHIFYTDDGTLMISLAMGNHVEYKMLNGRLFRNDVLIGKEFTDPLTLKLRLVGNNSEDNIRLGERDVIFNQANPVILIEYSIMSEIEKVQLHDAVFIRQVNG